MISAIMLIKCELKHVHGVTEGLADMEDVRELYTTTGEFDVVAILNEKDSEALAEAVTQRIATIPGISDTTTLLAIRRHSRKLLDRMLGVGFGSDDEADATPPSKK